MAFFGLFGGGKKGGGFDFQPYSGYRPPRIDREGQAWLRPTQDLTQKTIMDRSQGIGVGFDPERRNLLIDLTKSQLAQQEEDQLRDAQGRIASSGLSGNPRAYEALAGRVKRDTGRQLADSLSKISIEDLSRQNEERDLNTARLANLNQFNFGQENAAADFDLSVYNSEQGNRARAAGINQQNFEYDQNRRDDLLSSLGQIGGAVIGGTFGGPGGAMIGSQVGGQVVGGKGIGPQQYDFLNPMTTSSGPGFRKTAYRNLVR